MVEYAVEADPTSYYNLKGSLADTGEETENKYSGLTKEDARKLKKDLKNLIKMFEMGGHLPTWVKHKMNDMTKTLEEVE